jgi:hypothetical protein
VQSVDLAEIQYRGKAIKARSTQIDGRVVVVGGQWIKIASIKEEDLVEGQTVRDPATFVSELRRQRLKADVFTFAEKLPQTTPRLGCHVEWENLAVIPITTFGEWWKTRVESSVRRAVRKAEKSGVIARLAEFDDAFVGGIVDIYNETPIRQGRTFWHYQKDFETVRRENSTYLERSVYLGAYEGDQLIGFMRMIVTDKVASIVQILSKLKESGKRPTNALIAKAVEIAEQRGLEHLVYCSYVYNDADSSLTEFKRRNGFQQVLLPRYFLPLTLKGRISLKLGLHRGVAEHVPASVRKLLLRARRVWHERRAPGAAGAR